MTAPRRLIRLDLPPAADLTSARPVRVTNPANGLSVEAPVEICGEGVRMWHERARAIGLGPGMPALVEDPA